MINKNGALNKYQKIKQMMLDIELVLQMIKLQFGKNTQDKFMSLKKNKEYLKRYLN